jgi:CubicO group peptidase (beta-lactamase class C family)
MHELTVVISATLVMATACVAQPSRDGSASVVATPLGSKLDSALRRAAAEGFSGVALIEKDGDVILKKGYGMANRAEKIPMSPATVVQIGSNTKDFTAVAILQLMERGRLELSDSIGKYFPGVPADKRGITIRQLLNHRAGFPQHLGPDFDSVSREEEIRNALAAPLRFRPGEGRGYSNVGYSLLGAIIEQLSGKSYDEYIRDEILEPAGLRETGFLLPRFDDKRLAHGYSGDDDRGTMLAKPHASDGPYWNLRANGGMLSTVGDMHRFYRVLAGETLLKPATRDLMFPPNEPAILAGSDMVNFFLYDREPQAKVTMIIATNSTTLNAERVRGRLAPLLGLENGDGRREVVTSGPGRPSARSAAQTDPLKTLPDSPAGKAVLAYVKAYNSGDLATMGDFMRQSMIQPAGNTRTLDQRLATYKRMHDDIGSVTLLGVESSTADRIVARMATEHGNQVTTTFDIEPQPPYRIRGIRIEAR